MLTARQQYRIDNIDKINAQDKEYRAKNKDKRKEYYELNKDKARIYCKTRQEKTKLKRQEYLLLNKDKIEEEKKQRDILNIKKGKESDVRYRLKNKDKIAAKVKLNRNKSNEYQRNRRATNPVYKLSHNVRSLISQSVKKSGYNKSSKTEKILGCTILEFKEHLEKQFTKGMSWSNQGEWEIDHIYPQSKAIDEKHLLELNHFSNFQPLWRKDNRIKSNYILINHSQAKFAF